MKSAEERFGEMSRFEQDRLKRLMKKADSGAELTVKEAQDLRAFGSRAAKDAASESLRAKGRRAGIAGSGLLRGEEAEIKRNEAEQKAQELIIKDQRDLKVTIERDDDALAAKLGAEIRKEMEYRDNILIQKVRDEMRASRAEANRAQETKNNTANAGAGA